MIGDQIIGIRHRLDGAITDIDLRRGQKIYRLAIVVESSSATKSSTEPAPSSNQSAAVVVDPNIVAQTSKGIKQGRAPNCWFIASLAALADSPGGPNQIAKLINKTGTTYRVTFAEPGNWVDVGSTDLSLSSVKEAPTWAQVLDCACQKKYPDPVDGTTGLRILTGQPVHLISPTEEPDHVSEILNQISAKKRLLGDGTIQVNLRAINENFNGIVWADWKNLPEVVKSSSPTGKAESSQEATKSDPKLAADRSGPRNSGQ